MPSWLMRKYKLEFIGAKITGCHNCRMAKQVAADYWRSEIQCAPYKRFIKRYVSKQIKPAWCPLMESDGASNA